MIGTGQTALASGCAESGTSETAAGVTEARGWPVREGRESPCRDIVMSRRGQRRGLHVEQEVWRRRCAWGRKKGLSGRVVSKVAMHGGAVISCNCLIQGSRNIDKPLIF